MKKIIITALVLGIMLPTISMASTGNDQKIAIMKQLLGLYQQLLVLVQTQNTIVQVGEPVKNETNAYTNWQNNGFSTDYYRSHPACGDKDQYADPKSGNYNALCDRTLNPLRAN